MSVSVGERVGAVARQDIDHPLQKQNNNNNSAVEEKKLSCISLKIYYVELDMVFILSLLLFFSGTCLFIWNRNFGVYF